MTIRVAMLALVCAAPCALVFAQNEPPPSDTTTPSTSQPAPKEAPTTERSTARPSSASSPHQRQATGKEPHAQMMKDCIAKERAADSSMSEKTAKKNCKDQMKSSESSNR